MSVATFSLIAACGGDTVEYRSAHPTGAAVQNLHQQHDGHQTYVPSTIFYAQPPESKKTENLSAQEGRQPSPLGLTRRSAALTYESSLLTSLTAPLSALVASQA